MGFRAMRPAPQQPIDERAEAHECEPARQPYGTFSNHRRAAKALTRGRLLDAACEVILTVGAHGMTVDRLVSEAGVSRGTFYQHFESREDVIAALRLDMTSRLDDHYGLLGGMGDADESAYRRWLLDLVGICRADRKVVLAIMRAHAVAGSTFENRAYYHSIVERLAQSLESFAMTRVDPLLRARALLIFMQIESVIRYFLEETSSKEEQDFAAVVASEIYRFVNRS